MSNKHFMTINHQTRGFQFFSKNYFLTQRHVFCMNMFLRKARTSIFSFAYDDPFFLYDILYDHTGITNLYIFINKSKQIRYIFCFLLQIVRNKMFWWCYFSVFLKPLGGKPRKFVLVSNLLQIICGMKYFESGFH